MLFPLETQNFDSACTPAHPIAAFLARSQFMFQDPGAVAYTAMAV